MSVSRLIRWLGLAVALAPGYPAPASTNGTLSADSQFTYEEPKYLAGRIYARDSAEERLLFTFKRVATRSGVTLRAEREYQYPDGRTAAREHVVYQGNDLVLYQLEELQIGAAGSAKLHHDPQHPAKSAIDFEYAADARTKARPKARTESLRDDTLINDMVGPFLAAHWDSLNRGEKVKCRYIVVPRTETVGFVFKKESETTWHGRKATLVKMEPGSPIIAALVEPLFFTLESSPPHHVLQYVGRTTPRIEAGGKWKDLDAVTVFDWSRSK